MATHFGGGACHCITDVKLYQGSPHFHSLGRKLAVKCKIAGVHMTVRPGVGGFIKIDCSRIPTDVEVSQTSGRFWRRTLKRSSKQTTTATHRIEATNSSVKRTTTVRVTSQVVTSLGEMMSSVPRRVTSRLSSCSWGSARPGSDGSVPLLPGRTRRLQTRRQIHQVLWQSQGGHNSLCGFKVEQ